MPRIFCVIMFASGAHHKPGRLASEMQQNMLYTWDRIMNTLRLRQNGRHFPNHILKCILLNENVSISITISLKFVPKGPINNIPALVQIMTWRRPGDKPLSKPLLVTLLMQICITRSQWVNQCRVHNRHIKQVSSKYLGRVFAKVCFIC